MTDPPPAATSSLLDAVVAVNSELELPVVLRRIVEAAIALLDARFGALGVLEPQRRFLQDFVHVGFDEATADLLGQFPEGKGLLGTLIVDPRPLRVDVMADHPDYVGFPDGHPDMTSFIGVPVLVRGEVFGNLYLTDKRGLPGFTEHDEELLVTLAAAAGVAIEKVRLYDRVRQLSMMEDRERIARDLHDTVIQQLFAIGLSLQATAGRSSDPAINDRIAQAVRDLDDTVGRIRTTIFDLQSSAALGRQWRDEILRLADDASEQLGKRIGVIFDGPIDSLVGAQVGEHLVATVQEALSNVLKHAAATAVDVRITADTDHLVAVISDNGRGFDPSIRSEGQGLVNMQSRAEELGGQWSITAEPAHGTVLTWDVPLID